MHETTEADAVQIPAALMRDEPTHRYDDIDVWHHESTDLSWMITHWRPRVERDASKPSWNGYTPLPLWPTKPWRAALYLNLRDGAVVTRSLHLACVDASSREEALDMFRHRLIDLFQSATRPPHLDARVHRGECETKVSQSESDAASRETRDEIARVLDFTTAGFSPSQSKALQESAVMHAFEQHTDMIEGIAEDAGKECGEIIGVMLGRMYMLAMAQGYRLGAIEGAKIAITSERGE